MTAATRPIVALVLLAALSGQTRGAETNDWTRDATLDELFFHAQRYGTTARKKAQRGAARRELKRRGGEALQYLVARTHIRNPVYFILAHQLVRSLDKAEGVPALLTCLDTEEVRVRKTAVFFLGLYDAPEHADVLRPLLADDELAGVATRTLGKWQSRAVLAAALDDLQHDKERRRILAANALRDLRDPAAAPALVRALGDPIFTVRRVAERALLALGQDAVPALLPALGNPDVTTVRAAVRTLARIEDTRALPQLKLLAEHADPFVRREALAAMTALAPGGNREGTP